MEGGENEKKRCNQPIFFLFLHRCSVERRGNDFIEKKACFRLSDSVNLDSLRMLVRILGNQACLLSIYCQSGGACSSVFY